MSIIFENMGKKIKSGDFLLQYQSLIKKHEEDEKKRYQCIKNKFLKINPQVKIDLKIDKPIFNQYVYKNYGNLKIDQKIYYFIFIEGTNSDLVYNSVINKLNEVWGECNSKHDFFSSAPDIRKTPIVSGSIGFIKSPKFIKKQKDSKFYQEFLKWIGNGEPYPGDENSHLFLPKIEQIKGTKPDSESSGEKTVRIFLEDNKIKFKQYHKMKGCFSEKNGKCYLLTFDFFIPSKNLVIEYDGGQHFAPVSKFGGQETFERTVMLDGIKNKFCEDNGIEMLRIPFTKKKTEVYQILKKALGLPE